MAKFSSIFITALCFATLTSCSTTSSVSSPNSPFGGKAIEIDALPQSVKAFTGDPSPMDPPNLWMAAAKGDDVDAQFIVSMMYRDEFPEVANYRNGVNGKKDVDQFREMIRWWFLAEQENYAFADLSKHPSFEYVSSDFSVCPSSRDTLSWLETSANHTHKDENGNTVFHSNAEFILGLIYYNGLCVIPDKSRGVELIQRAAYHDNATAQYYLGMMYELGIGMQMNKDLANRWLMRAAEAPSPSRDAEVIMAIKLLDGIDVTPDPKLAEKYLNDSRGNHYWAILMTNDKGEFDRICTVDYDSVDTDYMHESGCGDEDYYDDDDYDDDDDDDDYDDDDDDDYDDDDDFEDGGGSRDIDDDEDEDEDPEFEYELDNRAEGSISYSVNYELANQWLYKAAKGNNNNAILLRSQAIYNEGCKGTLADGENVTSDYDSDYDLENKIVSNLLIQLIDNGYEDAEQYFMSYYDEEDDYLDVDDLVYVANKLGSSEMYDAVARTYRYDEDNYFRAYKYYVLAGDEDDIASIALDIAEEFDSDDPEDLYEDEEDLRKLINEDPVYILDADNKVNAFKWYEIAAEHGSRTANSKLGSYYEKGLGVPKDIDKALYYYYKIINKGINEISMSDQYLSSSDVKALVGIINIDNSLSEYQVHKYSRLIYDHCRDYYKRDYCPQYEKTVKGYVKLEGLVAATENEILKEHDKPVEQFFIIKSGLNPCVHAMKRYRDDEDDGDELFDACQANTKKLYLEAVPKAIKGITALSIAMNGKPDLELIVNTYYDIRYLNLNFKDAYTKKLKTWSPVAAEILSSNLYTSDRKRLLYSWYIRQIPYAAKDIYDAYYKGNKTWEECLKEAEAFIKDNQNELNIILMDVSWPVDMKKAED